MNNTLRVIYLSCILQMKQSFSRPTFRFCVVVQPILYGLITYIIFKNSAESNFITFVILGTGLLSLWSTICFSSAGDINRERMMGTLPLIISVPVRFEIIMLGKIIGNTLLGALSILITFVFVKIAFSVQVAVSHPVAFLLTFLLSIIGFMAVAMLLAVIFTISRKSAILMNCMEYPIFILCGILFPLDMLPVWLKPLSYILVPTCSAKLLRQCVLGIENTGAFGNELMIMLILTVLYFVLSVYLFRIIDKKVRIKATLEVY